VTALPPRRPWHKRKRTWAAVAVWLVVAYPLSVGPANYAAARGWASIPLLKTAYTPVFLAAVALDPSRSGSFIVYVDWCGDLGQRHAASD
jgi:hypothetical protein